jgi:hypothetical protein
MRRYILRACVGAAAWAAFVSTGCTEIYLAFGPGALFGPQQSSAVGGATTRPAVILSPLFLSDQADPLLEATAGAKVVVAAQLNDDNGDGVIDDNDEIDFVSGSDESQPIQIHLNQGGGLAFSTISIAGGGPIARMIKLAVTDIDVDGRPDIAVLVNDTGFTPVEGADLRGAVVLLFAPPDPANALAWTEVTVNGTFVLPDDDVGMTDFAVVDIDLDVEADGVTPRGPDIVLASNEVEDVQDYLRLYLNPGRGGGAAHLSRNGALWGNGSAITVDAVPFRGLAAADIDRDGDLDLVTASPTAKTHNISWFVNPRIPAGVGAVTATWRRDFVGQQQDGGDFVDVADIDGDGDLDVAAAKVSEGLVQWFENPDDPAAGVNIVTQQTFPWRVFNLGKVQSGFDISQMRLVDLNRDGAVDCFVTANGSMAGMQRGLDLYDFWLQFSIVTTNPVATIGRCGFADVNRDGLLDIIAPLDRTGLTQDQIIIYRRLTP